MMQCWGAVFPNLPIGAALHVDSQMIELSKQKLFAVEIARRKQRPIEINFSALAKAV